MGAFEMVVSFTLQSFSTWTMSLDLDGFYRIIMDQALLQLLALCLDIIFRFVPSNGFANEEVRDEEPPMKSMKATSTTMKARAMNTRFPRVLTRRKTFLRTLRSPRGFTQKIHVRWGQSYLMMFAPWLLSWIPVSFFLEGMEHLWLVWEAVSIPKGLAA